MPHVKPLKEVLLESARPVFLFGSTPPREGTSVEDAKATCSKFAARSAVLATDGFIVYDIQDEGARTTSERPFPFRKTMDPAEYAALFPGFSGKECIVYKCVTEASSSEFDDWLDHAARDLKHHSFTLVGSASSSETSVSVGLSGAASRTRLRPEIAFGCVCIPERHTIKKNENINMFNKVSLGAQWFITQGIFDADPAIATINDYSDLCRTKNIIPKKVILTFAPCGRAKTMTFIKWLGMHVPAEVEKAILESQNPVQTSIAILNEILVRILKFTAGSGVPLGLNVESLSIFKEEINGAHELFQTLQATLLNSQGSPWVVRWLYVRNPSDYYANSPQNCSRQTSNKDKNNAITNFNNSKENQAVIPASAAVVAAADSTKQSSEILLYSSLACIVGVAIGSQLFNRR